jgi:hypothetical protein
MGEEVSNLGQRGGVGVIADNRVRFDLLGGYLEIISARTQQGDRVALVVEPLSNDATQFGVAASNQYLHRHDLLIFTIESRCRPV